MTIRFDGRVAVVTGAGAGLGRCHALLLASRGAKVVVNDPGVAVDGSGSSTAIADQVVAEITAAGGTAVASYDSVAEVEGAANIVACAVNNYGRLDILVNNAGVLRDRTFTNLGMDDFALVVQVHLMGTVYCTKAAWPIMRSQRYGRIVVTTSGSGIVGSFGQSNYGAAKMGVLGLMNVLRMEGARYDILINAISPSATTRMTASLFPDHLKDLLRPELVSPAVAYLCSEACRSSGDVIAAGAGHFAKVQSFSSDGVLFDPARPASPEEVAQAYDAITDMHDARPFLGALRGAERKLRERGIIAD